VLENLIIDTRDNLCLFPKDRYAKMRNVFFIPDLLVMESWLLRAGFTDIRCVDVTRTSMEEQRKTPWIQTESLKDFLDPHDPDKTVEGYPAPVRAIFTANAT
jgi:tRNA (mo5U34)-methyltransferase